MKKIMLIILAAALGGAAVYGWRSVPKTNPFDSLPVETASRGELLLTIEEVGIIRARKSEAVIAPFSGKITRILDDGSSVTKGQTVVWMDTENVQKNLDEQTTNLKSTKTDLERTIEELIKGMRNNTLQVESAAADLEFARLKLLEVNRNLDTTQLLVDQNIEARTRLDTARQKVESETFSTLSTDLEFQKDMKDKESEESSRIAELGKVKLRSMKAQRNISEAQEKIVQAELKAPADGLLILSEEFNWMTGKNVKPQSGDEIRESRILAEIPDLSSLIILSQVSEEDISKVSENQQVIVTMDAFSDIRLNAQLSRKGKVAIARNMSPAGNLSSETEDTGQKVFELDFNLDSTDPRLRPGMTANISIILDKAANVLTVPLKGVFQKNGNSVVYLKNTDGYEERIVTIGRKNRERVEILSGIKEGERIFMKDMKMSNGRS
ncbi:MAG TPA: hypothetical protein PLB62_02495 [Candidatus Sumerlaeota bacterium]|nr:hypothetical protein [Candidatus Sumerlaeota bacterium]